MARPTTCVQCRGLSMANRLFDRGCPNKVSMKKRKEEEKRFKDLGGKMEIFIPLGRGASEALVLSENSGSGDGLSDGARLDMERRWKNVWFRLVTW